MRTLMVTMAAMIAAASLVLPEPTEAVDLRAFLAEVEEAGRFPTSARAELRVHVKERGDERHYDGVVAYSGHDLYLELRQPASRVVIHTGKDSIERVHQISGNDPELPVSGTAYDVVGATTLIVDDFRSFRAGVFKTPQITSETKRTLLVSGAPADASPYVLLVYLLDREKHVPTRVQYYERTLSNLVRMRRDTESVRVSDQWLPGRTEIEDYRTGTVTTIERRWTVGTELPPDLFDPTTLPARSLLVSP